MNEIRKLIHISLPIVVGQVGLMLFGVMDNMMVGHLGATELAAVGFANIVQILPFIALIGISSAVSVLVSQFEGAREYKKCGLVLLAGLIVSTVMAVPLISLYFIWPDILNLFAQKPEVVSLAHDYFALTAISLLPGALFAVVRQFCTGLDRLRFPTVLLFVALALNGLLNWIFIYGHFGLSPMGVKGAALATLIARVFLFAVMLIWVARSKFFTAHMHWSLKQALGPAILRPFLKIGLPSSVQMVIEVAAFAFAGIMAGWVGVIESASHQVAINVASLTFMFPLGVSIAAGVRVSRSVGEKNLPAAHRSAKAAFQLGAMVMGFFAVVLVSFGTLIPELYTNDVLVLKIAAQLLLVAAVFQVFDGLQVVALGALRGYGDVNVPTMINTLAYWVVSLPLGYLLGFKYGLGVLGIWLGLALGVGVAAILLLCRAHRIWRR